MYFRQFEEYKPVSEVQNACIVGAVINGMLLASLVLNSLNIGYSLRSPWSLVLVYGLFNATMLITTLWKMWSYRDGLSGFWRIYLERNIIGYDVVEMGGTTGATRRVERRDQRTPEKNIGPYAIYIKLGGWGFGRRVRLMEYRARGFVDRGYWSISLRSDSSVIVRDPARLECLSMSIEFLLRILTATGGELGSVGFHRLYRLWQDEQHHSRTVLDNTINRLDATKRFVHSQEGMRIREWLESIRDGGK
jgi:hypothetical protein